jgi:hypothetical protein
MLMKTETCKTFETPREALAFLMGLRCGQNEGIGCRIDPQETQTVLVDLEDDDAHGIYLAAADKFNKTVANNGITGALKMAQVHMENGDPVEAETMLDLVLRANPALEIGVRNLLEKAHNEISVGTPDRAEYFLDGALARLDKETRTKPPTGWDAV